MEPQGLHGLSKQITGRKGLEGRIQEFNGHELRKPRADVV